MGAYVRQSAAPCPGRSEDAHAVTSSPTSRDKASDPRKHSTVIGGSTDHAGSTPICARCSSSLRGGNRLPRSARKEPALGHCTARTARNVLYSRANRLLPLIHPALNACSRCKDVATPLPPHICGDHRQLLYSALLRLPSSVRTSRSRKPPGPRHGGGPTEPPRPCGQAQLRTSGCAPSHLTRASPAACQAAGDRSYQA